MSPLVVHTRWKHAQNTKMCVAVLLPQNVNIMAISAGGVSLYFLGIESTGFEGTATKFTCTRHIMATTAKTSKTIPIIGCYYCCSYYYINHDFFSGKDNDDLLAAMYREFKQYTPLPHSLQDITYICATNYFPS